MPKTRSMLLKSDTNPSGNHVAKLTEVQLLELVAADGSAGHVGTGVDGIRVDYRHGGPRVALGRHPARHARECAHRLGWRRETAQQEEEAGQGLRAGRIEGREDTRAIDGTAISGIDVSCLVIIRGKGSDRYK